MIKNKRIIQQIVLLALLFFTSTNSIFGQLSYEGKVDKIYAGSNDLSKPGLAAAVIKNGEVLYLKGFGSANLETKAPITVRTKFEIDNLSKQFTVLAILLLEQIGTIHFDNDIREYIPQLPKYKETITVRHLLNQTSGLNDYDSILRIMGSNANDVFTHEDALHLISSQEMLNFKPGTDFSDFRADTEITLMAEIVAKASGQTLSDFTKEYIFEPLHMKNTLFSDDFETIIPNKAISYQASDKGYKKRVLNSGNSGPKNLYTSAEDLVIWYKNFSPKSKGKLSETIKKLHTPVTNNNGTVFHSYWGILTWARDFLHPERGIPKYWQYGSMGGYRSRVFLVPGYDIVAFALANNNKVNGFEIMATLEPLLEKEYTLPATIDYASIETINLSTKKLKAFEGNYHNQKSGNVYSLLIKNDTLRVGNAINEEEDSLLPITENIFQMMVEGDDTFILEFEKSNNKKTMSLISAGSHPSEYKYVAPIVYSTKELDQFTGSFYNSALSTNYTLTIEDGKLIASHITAGKTEFTPVTSNVFISAKWFFRNIRFTSKNGQINGFTILADGINKLEFNKINEPIK